MPKYVNVGYNNAVSGDNVIAVLTAGSLPCRRLIQQKRDNGMALDSTAGNKLKSVIVLDNGYLMLSAINVTTIINRLNEADTKSKEAEAVK